MVELEIPFCIECHCNVFLVKSFADFEAADKACYICLQISSVFLCFIDITPVKSLFWGRLLKCIKWGAHFFTSDMEIRERIFAPQIPLKGKAIGFTIESINPHLSRFIDYSMQYTKHKENEKIYT